MPIDHDYWKKAIKQATRNIADEEYQRDNWFGHGKYVSSPGETPNQLFDDHSFETFIQDRTIDLNRVQFDAARNLIEALNDFIAAVARDVAGDIDPRLAIDHPKWKAAREAARLFSQLL